MGLRYEGSLWWAASAGQNPPRCGVWSWASVFCIRSTFWIMSCLSQKWVSLSSKLWPCNSNSKVAEYSLHRPQKQGNWGSVWHTACFSDPKQSYRISWQWKYTEHEFSQSPFLLPSLLPASPNTLSRSLGNSVKMSHSEKVISYENLGPFSSKHQHLPSLLAVSSGNNIRKQKWSKWSKCTKLQYFRAFFHARKGNAYERKVFITTVFYKTTPHALKNSESPPH